MTRKLCWTQHFYDEEGNYLGDESCPDPNIPQDEWEWETDDGGWAYDEDGNTFYFWLGGE